MNGARETPPTRKWRRDPEWTRAALVEALLELVGEGAPEPTRKQIADRAGVSERTAFVHFTDREAMYEAAARRQAERWQALAEPVKPAWATRRKVAALLAQRARMYELMSPIRRVGLALEPDSPALRQVMAEGDRWFRDDLALIFAPELAESPGAAEPGGLLDALDAACSWATWEHLRARRGLTPDDAVRALGRTLLALLA
ncbi:TetR/AcrR family transcriptional regulator [Kitasatospora viridis]|uniref:TetR family transcriptional regulator n=1 Tax=Kitasatospora viridis TaxID=281105 RepID=A0A561UQA7_9ACTN|nr:TetR/AcrR family transcriptional regulator [Kitasatospora viridis]TWG01545.1 TetR family transcriptional regulator [Kitasatospora viridis]